MSRRWVPISLLQYDHPQPPLSAEDIMANTRFSPLGLVLALVLVTAGYAIQASQLPVADVPAVESTESWVDPADSSHCGLG